VALSALPVVCFFVVFGLFLAGCAGFGVYAWVFGFVGGVCVGLSSGCHWFLPFWFVCRVLVYYVWCVCVKGVCCVVWFVLVAVGCLVPAGFVVC